MASGRDAGLHHQEQSADAQFDQCIHRQTVDSNFTPLELEQRQNSQRMYSEEQDITANSATEYLNARILRMQEIQRHESTQGQDNTNPINTPQRPDSVHSQTDIARSVSVSQIEQFTQRVSRQGQSQIDVNELRDLLRNSYKETRWMKQFIALAGLQFVPVAISFLYLISDNNITHSNNQRDTTRYLFTNPWWYFPVSSQPLGLCYGVFFCLCTSQRHFLRRELLCFPCIWWLLLATSMAPYIVFFCTPEGMKGLSYMPLQLVGLMLISCLWLLGSGWNKWRGTTACY